MAKIGDALYEVDHRYAPAPKRYGDKFMFHILSTDMGDPIDYHYLDRPDSRYGMPVLCLASCGGTIADCEKLPVPVGGFLHTAQKTEEGKTAFPRRKFRILIWNYNYPNEATETEGRVQLCELGGTRRGEMAQIDRWHADEDIRRCDIIRSCQDENKRICALDIPRSRPTLQTEPPEEETKESCKKFFVEFLKEQHAAKPFLTQEIAKILVMQWEEAWELLHSPVGTLEDVQRSLSRLAELYAKQGNTPVQKHDTFTFGSNFMSESSAPEANPADTGTSKPAATEAPPTSTETLFPETEEPVVEEATPSPEPPAEEVKPATSDAGIFDQLEL